nr:EthD family reductase [Novosphingobium hassiacum]
MYNAPVDPQAFEDYYAATHMPIAGMIPMVDKIVLLKGMEGPDGSAPAYYRMAQIYFADATTMATAMATAEAQAATSDIVNFATGGASVFIAEVV